MTFAPAISCKKRDSIGAASYLAWSIFVSWRRNARLLQEAMRGKTSRLRTSRAPVCACGSRAIGLLGKCTEIWAMNGWLPKVAEPLGSGRYLYDFHKMWETLSPLSANSRNILFLTCCRCTPPPAHSGCHISIPPGMYRTLAHGVGDGGGWFFGGVWHPPVASWTITFSDGEIVHLLHNFIFWGRFRNERRR